MWSAIPPDKFADTVKALIEREAVSVGLKAGDYERPHWNNRKDRGIDAHVLEGSEQSAWLVSPTAFQFKHARPTLSAIMKELEQSPDLQDLLARGTRYTLVYAQNSGFEHRAPRG